MSLEPEPYFKDQEKKTAESIRNYLKAPGTKIITSRMSYLLEKYPEEEN